MRYLTGFDGDPDMARIPEADIERLKRDVALARLAEAAGIALKRHGADLIGLCPFHDDHEPSLVITPGKNLWHCLGACQSGGSVIDWVMRMEGVSFRHAVELLREGVPAVAANRSPVKQGSVRKLAPPVTLEADDQALLNQVIDYYHETLQQSPDALGYLEKRGIADRAAIDHFKLGFANRTLGYRLPNKNRVAGAELRSRLQKLGLYRDSGHEHFSGSLIIPVLDDNGNVVDVYGRKINDRLRKGTPLHLYLPGPHRGVWNLAALQQHHEIILCESLIDALTFWCAGFKNVTASYGVEGFTKHHLHAFKDHGIERVLIAYDRDEAGNGAAEKLARHLNQHGIDTYRVLFPKGMDANAYACQVQPAAKSLGVVIRSAEWLGKGEPKPLPNSLAADVQGCTNTAGAGDGTDAGGRATQGAVAECAGAVKENTSIKEDLATLAEDLAAPLPASPVPAAPQSDVPVEVKQDDLHITLGDRHYRLRGLQKNLSVDQLKVNVLASRNNTIYVDTFDLYSARHRQTFIKQAAIELDVTEDVIKTDLGKVLLQCEALQEQHITETLKPKMPTVNMTATQHDDALDLLKQPDLLGRILSDFSRCGVVGEETNKLVGYLAAVSRKLDEPLAIIIQSTSAAGKSALMDAVLAMMPEEDRVQYSAMTGQSLFYMGETDLQHKILAISEEEGAHQAAYALKLLQSEGQVTIASTGKDPDSGKHVTHEYKVEGPVMIFLTTTAIDIDEELMNRCLVLTVDEHRDQTRAIHQLQRKKRTLQGLQLKQDKQRLLTLHHNAQRLLRPLAVVNPYAEHLTFLDDRTRTRRDHEKYLTLIDSIALLHQYQRPIKTLRHGEQTIEYIEVTLDDIAAANDLAHDVLGRSLDELPPQTRRLLSFLDAYVADEAARLQVDRSAIHFSRKAIRDASGLGDTQLKIHLQRLVEMEYVLLHKQGNRFTYELLYEGQGMDGQAFLMGLIDPATLFNNHDYDAKRSGGEPDRSGSGRPTVGGPSGSGRSSQTRSSPLYNGRTPVVPDDDDENRDQTKKSTASYRNRRPSLVARSRG